MTSSPRPVNMTGDGEIVVVGASVVAVGGAVVDGATVVVEATVVDGGTVVVEATVVGGEVVVRAASVVGAFVGDGASEVVAAIVEVVDLTRVVATLLVFEEAPDLFFLPSAPPMPAKTNTATIIHAQTGSRTSLRFHHDGGEAAPTAVGTG